MKAVRNFYKSFEGLKLNDLSTSHIQKLVNFHKLTVDDLLGSYTKKPKDLK